MRTVLAGFAGGILMFVWASIAHVALPLGQAGVSGLPNEAGSMAAMSTALGDHEGLFIFPDMREGRPMANKTGNGPTGFLIYHPHGSYEMKPSQLVAEFVKELAEAMIAAVLLYWSAVQGYGARLGFVTLIGVVAAIATNASYWTWYGFPLSYTLSYGAIQLIGYVAAGLAIAWVVPQRALSSPRSA